MKIRHFFTLLVFCFLASCNKNEKENECDFDLIQTSHVNGKTFVSVNIENEELNLGIDLGYNGYLSLEKKSFEKIQNKTFFSKRKYCGVRGIEHTGKTYLIPKMKLKNANFTNLLLKERDEEFAKETTFSSNPDRLKLDPNNHGSIGWKIFERTNLFLDLGHNEIAFCDDFKTLEKEGYETEQFSCTPLLLDNDMLEIEVLTSEGSLRCLLDNGCTWSLLNSPPEFGATIEEALINSKNSIHFTSFRIGGKEFGPAELTKVPLNLPFELDGILGLDFFKQHFIFIDFTNQKVYISSNESHPRPAKNRKQFLTYP